MKFQNRGHTNIYPFKIPSNLQVKDTLYKFWVLKVRLRDWGFNGDGDGGVNNTLALTHDRSFNQTNCSRIGSQHCRMTESTNGRNHRGKKFYPKS